MQLEHERDSKTRKARHREHNFYIAKVCCVIIFSFLDFICMGILPTSYVCNACVCLVPTEVRGGLLDPLGLKLQVVESPCGTGNETWIHCKSRD